MLTLVPLPHLIPRTLTGVKCTDSGHETTAGALTWALYALTLYPEMQDRLRKEISGLDASKLPSYSDIEGLVFLNNFTKEVLRYYPPGKQSSRGFFPPQVQPFVV